ncbi:ribonuclease PH [Desulfurispira natronophila]|uniref:Ribonuclease PH n=1 Tax=Desulfurispira natronophila TaxID=682562 RepID=A0A7W7Y4B2_9BACT|nr:ribonuclease PH [Desulfurispira natronophila]MBB5021851.1 ribonuclease PH [Desulfurispira natronophila]
MRTQRPPEKIRPLTFTRNYTRYAEGSVLVEAGETKVLCNATVEQRVPRFLMGQQSGWVTAEYAMLPRATHSRNRRESQQGRPSGRTMEIQRLIGRSLRSIVNLKNLDRYTITVDCDVLQADGGTRCASINGAFIALADAVEYLLREECITQSPIRNTVAAVSVGLFNDWPLVDLDYTEDSQAAVDMNVVATGNGEFVEVQGAGEERPFSRSDHDTLIDLALDAIGEISTLQHAQLSSVIKEQLEI